MKKNFLNSMLLMAFIGVLFFSADAFAKGSKVVNIKTSAGDKCCAERIENGLKALDGVESVKFDATNKVVAVKFQEGKVKPEIIAQNIAKTGYDASIEGTKISYKGEANKECCSTKDANKECDSKDKIKPATRKCCSR